ncbi:MAG: hypothetical protein ACRDZ2_00105 [Ilumatobacteraceae bacterium]
MAPQGAPGAINIFTVTPSRFRWLKQRNRFRTLRLSQWRARNYSGREAGNVTLKRLDILHTATWLRLGRFPQLPDCPQEDVHHVLFCSNFSGEWNPYRQAFLDVLGTGIRSAWGGSEGLPRFPKRGTRYAVEEWQRHRLPTTQHYYRAYPGLAPSEVRGAVRMARQLEAFALKADAGAIGPGDDPNDTAFRQLQRRLTTAFGGSPAGILPGAAFGPPRCTGMSNFVSVVPIVPGREEDVARRICRLPDGEGSPFRHVEGTHFARLAVLDRRTASFHPRNAIVLRHSWLLFAADVDGHFGVREPGAERMDPDEVHRYVTAVDRSSRLRAVWQDCIGFHRDRPLADLIEPTVVPRFVLFLDHGDTTLRDIDDGLRLKHAYLRRLHSGDLDSHAGVARFLERVRANARAAQPMRALARA